MDMNEGRRKKKLKVISNDLLDLYPHELQMYSVPPGNEITLTEFEDLAMERLQVLRIIDLANNKDLKPFSNEWKDYIKQEVKKQNLNKFYRLLRYADSTNTDLDLQARRADHISHFILRLAYCRSDYLRKWYIARELDLFKLRFLDLTTQGILKFLSLNNLTYKPISSEEKSSIINELMQSTTGLYDSQIEITDFYKVPFTEVCTLVKNRKVYLNKGFAYIPNTELITCILTIFRAKLSEALAVMNSKLPHLDDDRIENLLSHIHTAYIGKNYDVDESKNPIMIDNLDKYSRKHFPMCMRHIHEVFKIEHHLKHQCRLQYGLFLKGIGVTFEDAMLFFKTEFTKIMDQDKFDRNYSYNIRHQYGKAGRMTSYSPFGCIKIISENVGPGQQHGCPFKHWDANALMKKLTDYGISFEGVKDIVDTATKGHYQVACGKYFRYTHGYENKNAIVHPNQYFEESFNSDK